MLKIKKPTKNGKKIELRNFQGFTLIEVMVSLAIFSLSMIVVGQLFFRSLYIQKFLVAHFQLVNEMSYNLEHISRGLRMAVKGEGASCLPQGVNFEQTAAGIKFQDVNPNGTTDCVEYYLGHPADYPSGILALMERRVGTSSSFDLPLTSPKIKILNFSVTGTGWSQSDRLQPRITIYIQAQNNENEILENQITVSQRNPDIDE